MKGGRLEFHSFISSHYSIRIFIYFICYGFSYFLRQKPYYENAVSKKSRNYTNVFILVGIVSRLLQKFGFTYYQLRSCENLVLIHP